MKIDPEKILEECRIAYFLSSGPGGQRRDRKRTAVRLVHGPTGIVVIAGRRRSRSQNLKAALDRLIGRLEERERERSRKPRIKTNKPIRVKESILREKKRRSGIKKLRKKVRGGDEDA